LQELELLSLTPLWSWALLERSPVVRTLDSFPTFYGTRRFNTPSVHSAWSACQPEVLFARFGTPKARTMWVQNLTRHLNPLLWPWALTHSTFLQGTFLWRKDCLQSWNTPVTKSLSMWTLPVPAVRDHLKGDIFWIRGRDSGAYNGRFVQLAREEHLKCFSGWKHAGMCVAAWGNYFEGDRCSAEYDLADGPKVEAAKHWYFSLPFWSYPLMLFVTTTIDPYLLLNSKPHPDLFSPQILSLSSAGLYLYIGEHLRSSDRAYFFKRDVIHFDIN
jgi:hypothetical protein